MIVLLTVAGMIFAMLLFSYIFLWSRRPDLWTAPPALTSFWLCAGLATLGLIASVIARKTYARAPALSASLGLASAIALATALWFDFASWRTTGLDPQLTSHDALIATALSWQTMFVLVSVLMALYLVARLIAGLLAKQRPATMDSVSLFLAYAGAQHMIALALTRLFPLAV